MILLITLKILKGLVLSYLKKLISMMPASHYQLGYLNDSNDAAHFVDTDVEYVLFTCWKVIITIGPWKELI